jgi:hypothetical protein
MYMNMWDRRRVALPEHRLGDYALAARRGGGESDARA